ncbi:polysaccharide pyruvyl transferase family protein [Microbacterium aquimaris]|uniref:polysaccharide pyruvyl transferase family protein n=1 Tax=Microbacterium aquimaris TaxID=459816 RepID=UPI002AD56568|nr:polysaccharide pyruvyl transferase family protein [Microbacterium aquimaris]MDZ8274538.1 polysaccharide pyruvyl transferase family protein [Microbacterium aquimaris]
MVFWNRGRKDRAPFYLVSSAGVPNYGDEFITRAWLDWLAAHHPDVPVWVDCLEPGRASHLFQDAHPLLKTTNTLWHLAFAGAGPSLEDGADYVQYLVRELGSPRFDAGLEHLRSVRSVHLLGGGYLNALWPHQLLLLPALTQLQASFGVPVHATGQGLIPADDFGSHVRGWVGSFSSFEVRDRASAELVGGDVGVDDAFLAFANRRPVFSSSASPDTMLLIQGDFDGGSRESIVDGAVDFISRHSAKPVVGVAESLPPDDGWLAEALGERGVEVEVFPFLRLWKEGFPGRAGQTWLTSRFHFHLLGASSGAAGAAVSFRRDYYDVKHHSLLDLGTGWEVASASFEGISAGLSADFSAPRHLDGLAKRKESLARKIYG